MNYEKSALRRKIQQKLGFWLLLISAGVVAYGIGLHQGSLFRMSRTIASSAPAVVATDIKPVEPEIVGPLYSPGNTELPKSRSK